MAWYGSHVDSTKKLDQLIQQSPSLEQLLNYPEFIQQLKSYNPKLLDYLTNSNTIISDLISYISIPPKENDSDDRKFKLPTLAIEMIESQAMSLINSFFKDDTKRKTKYLHSFFQQQFSNSNKVDGQILPMLAGYFLRVNICLLNNKYRETIDSMYQSPRYFELLLQNSHSLSVTNTLQVYLNLDLTKNPQTPPEKLTIKINTINRMIRLIDESIEAQKTNYQPENEAYLSTLRVQNLSSVLIELFEKYYLIADGKQMVDQILYQQNNTKVFFKNLLNKRSDISLSLLNILVSMLKYYTLSSFNNEEWNNPEQRKKNEQKLQSQPAIVMLIDILPDIINEMRICKSVTIYEAKLMELVSTSLGLNSHKIFNCVKNCKYFQILFDLFFRFESCNIFAIMLEKLFILIFRTQRLINEEIKHYIFCEVKIIEITAGRYLSQFQNDEQIMASMGCGFRRKGYFGHLMKIMKIYSGIQTTDEDIVNSIRSKSQIWNKVSRMILKPHELIANKELSTYENIPEMSPTQFTVKNINSFNTNLSVAKEVDNNKVIDEINREEAIQNLKTLETSIQQNKLEAQIITSSHNKETLQHKDSSDGFFEAPTAGSKQKLPQPILETKVSDSSKSDHQSEPSEREKFIGSPVMQKRGSSYNDFLEKQKFKAESEIRKERSRSKQRALSKGKTRITSPSPTRRVNKWSEDGENQEKKQVKERVSLTTRVPTTETPKNLPKIPMHKKGINVSTNSIESKEDVLNKSMQLEKKESIDHELTQIKSMPNLDVLRKVKILYRYDAPTKKEYRKITQQDKAIFDSLGIAYS